MQCLWHVAACRGTCQGRGAQATVPMMKEPLLRLCNACPCQVLVSFKMTAGNPCQSYLAVCHWGGVQAGKSFQPAPCML